MILKLELFAIKISKNDNGRVTVNLEVKFNSFDSFNKGSKLVANFVA